MAKARNNHVKLYLAVSVLSIFFVFLTLLPLQANAALNNYVLSTNDTYVSGSISVEDTVEQYKITLPSAGLLTVTYQGWSIYDSYYQLMDENLETSFFKHEIYYSSDTTPKTGEDSRYLEKGVYYVRVYPYSKSRTGTYRLKAKFEASGNNEAEPNNSFDTAMSLGANAKITGLISENDEIDFYKFSISGAQKVTITYQGMIKDSYMSLWNKDFESLHNKEVYYGSEATPKTYTYEEDLEAGTYYIKVTPYGSNRGRYTLTWKGSKTGTAAPGVTPTPAPDPTPSPTPPNTPSGGTKGSTVSDSSSQAQYTVTTTGSGTTAGEVSYEKRSISSSTVRIPDTITVNGVQYKVTSVSSKAFAGNNSIRKVVLGKNVKKIGSSAFANCKNLKTVKFNKNLTTIGNNAFSGCTVLKKIDLPKKLKKIGKKAFYGCKKLKKIIIRSSLLKKTKVGSKAFAKVSPNATAYVPSSKVKKYRKVLKGLSARNQIAPVM